MAKTPGELWRITGPTFTALIQFNGRGHVWWAAPAVKQMERWEGKKVLDYCKTRGWKVEHKVIRENYCMDCDRRGLCMIILPGTGPCRENFLQWEEVMLNEPKPS